MLILLEFFNEYKQKGYKKDCNLTLWVDIGRLSFYIKQALVKDKVFSVFMALQKQYQSLVK